MLLPALLTAALCTVLLGLYCMFLQAQLAMQAQEEDIRECLEAVPKAVEQISDSYDQNIANFDEVYRAKAATAAYIARYDSEYRETGYWVDQLGQQMEVSGLMILDNEGKIIASGDTMVDDYSSPEFDGLRDVFMSRKRHVPFEVSFGTDDAGNEITRRYYAARIDSRREAVVEQDPEELNAVQQDTVTWTNVLADIDVGMSGRSIAVDGETFEILDYPDPELLGTDIRAIGLRESNLQDGRIGWIHLQDDLYYAGSIYVPQEDVWVIVAVSQREIITKQKTSTAIVLAVFFAFLTTILVYAFSLIGEQEGFSLRRFTRKVRGLLMFGLPLIFLTAWYSQNLFAVSGGAVSVENDLLGVQNTIEANAAAQDEIRGQYNRRYLNKALMAAQILSRNPVLRTRMDLAGLSRALDVEYIILFDRTGLETVSDSEFVRFRISSDPGDQSYEFRQLLYGVPYVVQEAQPDELTGRYHQFIGAALRNESGEADGFLQISVMPDKLENMLKSASLDRVLSTVRASFGGFAFAVDGEKKTFLWYPEPDMIGKKIEDHGIRESALRDDYTDYLFIDGIPYFAASCEIDGNYIYVAVPENRLTSQSLRFAGLATAGAAALLLLLYFFLTGLKRREDRLSLREPEAAGLLPAENGTEDVTRTEEEDPALPEQESPGQADIREWWDSMNSTRRSFEVFRFFLLIFSVILAAVSVLRDYFPLDSIFSYIFSMKWERGLNLFSVTLCLMAVGSSEVLIMSLDKLLELLGNAMDSRGETLCRLLRSIVRYSVIVVMIFYMLSLFGVNTQAILASAGIMSIIIGIGSQSLISDIVNGLFIIFEGDFQVGDIVTINDCRGVVQEIGVRNTKILDDKGNLKIINNKQINGILNMTVKNSVFVTDVGIEYDEDIPRLEKILEAELPRFRKRLPKILGGPRYLGISSLGDSAIEIRVLTECREEDRFQLERDMRREMRLLFERYGINIPYPQIVLNRRKEE